ncbi:MAG: hypothetical protein C4520_09775 [Candidatus Abyssobacteria bacterium SURF_5]|uniref:Uncharacterized protein n=1 Tax=Abyssobacteria bacterium (strain SURF_5) TaxID=2093360 RepID=A0A3A4NKT9_ABYX5|nr:MAG: hypothetical protein C4520_09775 [Candidatus Abyssubacteria bacterium SURF_5]
MNFLLFLPEQNIPALLSFCYEYHIRAGFLSTRGNGIDRRRDLSFISKNGYNSMRAQFRPRFLRKGFFQDLIQ